EVEAAFMDQLLEVEIAASQDRGRRLVEAGVADVPQRLGAAGGAVAGPQGVVVAVEPPDAADESDAGTELEQPSWEADSAAVVAGAQVGGRAGGAEGRGPQLVRAQPDQRAAELLDLIGAVGNAQSARTVGELA